MKTRNDDFSDSTYADEQNIQGTFAFRNTDGKYYKLELDFSPASFMKVIKQSAVRPLSWQEYVKHSTEEEKKQYNGRAGHYIPAKNVNGIIASLIEEKVTA